VRPFPPPPTTTTTTMFPLAVSMKAAALLTQGFLPFSAHEASVTPDAAGRKPGARRRSCCSV